ncbi:alpha/beta hydrolase [Croceicoccus estronivorus]|uniref:alpha/beta fold hydrolase n=1 Tax=Croceicoccus estronivorus TaxID=1172626 RepID=UPI00082F95D0|nr:alpha/beta hydrolase [Croceicoccus estronivorus]OCC24713.1 alpha/beta hydrolase [Croceicoccus estronivorus]
MTRFGPTSQSFISQRSRMHYVDWGNTGAPLLILVHGNRDHCRSWDWTAEALSEKWHVVAPDLRGHGDSAWSPEGRYDFASYTYDLAQLAFELGGEPATIVAHSMGAHIALRYAGIYPDAVSKLIAIEAVGAPGNIDVERISAPMATRFRRWIEEHRGAAGHNARVYASVGEAQERMQAENPRLSDDHASHLTLHGLRRTEDGDYIWKFDNYLRHWPAPDIPQSAVFALWQNIACPTLLMFGKESWPSAMADDLMQYVPHVRRIDIEEAGHWLHHDRFDRFIGDLQAFLDE